jgi:hypothetical protein
MLDDDEVERENLRTVLMLLERADREAIRAKQQVVRIAGEDPASPDGIDLVPAFFDVSGHIYRAWVTPQQRSLIQDAAKTGTTKQVNRAITHKIFLAHLNPAIDLAFNILVAALRNQDLPESAALLAAEFEALANAGQGVLDKVTGACRFADGTCLSHYTSTLCAACNGTYVATCGDASAPAGAVDGAR